MRRRNDLSEGDLLRLAARGDEEAFVLLYRRHQGGIYRYVLRMTRSTSTAEEVTQDVFLALMREPSRFDASRGELGAFLFGIGRNLVRKHFERSRGEVLLSGEELDALQGRTSRHDAGLGARYDTESIAQTSNADPAQIFAQEQTVAQVRAAVATLPEEYREVIVLCELEEKSYEQAATLLECPVGTVRSRLHRARALLFAKLEILRGLPRRAAAG